MATNFVFIPERSRKSQHILYNVYRYSHEKTRDDVSTGSAEQHPAPQSSRLMLVDRTTIVKEVPHSHPPPVDENAAHVTKALSRA